METDTPSLPRCFQGFTKTTQQPATWDLLNEKFVIAFTYPHTYTREKCWHWCSSWAKRVGSQQTSAGKSKLHLCVCVSCFLTHPHLVLTRRYIYPERSRSHVNRTFPWKPSRDTNTGCHWRHDYFFSLSPWVIFSFMLRACQSVTPPTIPHLQTFPTSSLSVVDADMSHLEALPYMCCIDISPLTFPFPGGRIVKLL